MVSYDTISSDDVRRVAELTHLEPNSEETTYIDYHATRFAASLNLVREVINNIPEPRRIRIMDVGPHYLTRCLHHFFGDELVINTLGYSYEEMVPKRIINEHYAFDLNDSQYPARWVRIDEGHDIIVMAEVIEHLHTSPRLVLRFLRSLLKDGGTLIIQTPNACSFRKRVGLVFGKNPFEPIRESLSNPGHFREYTKTELRDYCVNSGFSEPEIVQQNYWPTDAMAILMGKIMPNTREGLLLTTQRVADALEDAGSAREGEYSDTIVGLGAELSISPSITVPAGGEFQARVKVRNTGTSSWLPEGSKDDVGVVRLGAFLYDEAGVSRGEFFRHHLPGTDPVHPGEDVELDIRIPATGRGTWELEFDMVAERVAWFKQNGSTPARYRIVVE